ncbi:Exonuclease mut-7 [Mortierella sp. 14UC]|nr:Exonuclease mut-7 [Mortierella sp. 14UC]
MPPPAAHSRSASLHRGKLNNGSRSSSPSSFHHMSATTEAPSRFKPAAIPPPRYNGTVYYGPPRPRTYTTPSLTQQAPPPYARVQRQVTSRDRSDSTVPTKGLEKMVQDNNALLFAQSLLGYLKSTAEYWRLDEHCQIEALIETIVSALSSHPDPPEFIIVALITVGTVAGNKRLDPEFELLVSALLAESLQRYLTWQRDLVEEHGNNSSGSSPLEYQCDGDGDDYEDEKDSGSGSDDTSVSAVVEESQFDLIVLDDDEDSTGQASHRTRSPHANIEPSIDALSTGLDDAKVMPELDANKVLEPTVLDLIDFSSWDRLETPSLAGSTGSSVDSKGWRIMKTTTTKTARIPIHSPLGDDNNDAGSVGRLLDIDLEELDGVNSFLKENTQDGKRPAQTNIAELVHIFDSHLQTDYQDTSDGDGEGDCSALDRGEADDEKEDSGDSAQEDDDEDDDDDANGPIQPHHRQKLKDELSDGKNALQVFAALDTIGMHRALRQLAPPSKVNLESTNTYGTLLAHQLLQKGRYRECIIVLSKDIGPSVGVEQALLLRLLELGEEEIIYSYIENDLERCRRVLLHINHQLSFQFYYWGLATTDMSQSDPPEYADVPPIPGAGRARIQTRLVETAMGLIMYFDLEEDQPSYKFLDMFVRFCTVSTLLNQSSPSTNSLPSNDPPQGTNKSQAPLAMAGQAGSGGATSGGAGREYLLTTPWRYVPLVLEMTRGSVTLQRMAIQHCIEKRDLITAKFLASKLDIMEYYLEIAESDGGPSSVPAAVKATHPGSPLSDAALAAAIAPGPVSLYRLPNETKIMFVRQAHQLESMSTALERSRVVGMDTEWLPNIPEFRHLQMKQSRTAIVQLASDVDSMVFVVDVIAFLEGADGGRRLIRVLGSLFQNTKILKLAFDWDGDQDMLEGTFPEMHQQHNRLQNFVDLKFLWFKIRDKSNGKNNSSPVRATGGTAPVSLTGMLEAWSSLAPSMPGMYTIPGGLSGLLARLCGHKLDKSEQCSQWEQRPLTASQLNYAASDAKCLLEIYAALMTIEQV